RVCVVGDLVTDDASPPPEHATFGDPRRPPSRRSDVVARDTQQLRIAGVGAWPGPRSPAAGLAPGHSLRAGGAATLPDVLALRSRGLARLFESAAHEIPCRVVGWWGFGHGATSDIRPSSSSDKPIAIRVASKPAGMSSGTAAVTMTCSAATATAASACLRAVSS